MKGEGESHSVSRHHGPRATCHVPRALNHASRIFFWEVVKTPFLGNKWIVIVMIGEFKTRQWLDIGKLKWIISHLFKSVFSERKLTALLCYLSAKNYCSDASSLLLLLLLITLNLNFRARAWRKQLTFRIISFNLQGYAEDGKKQALTGCPQKEFQS